jgi:hypothetical protein
MSGGPAAQPAWVGAVNALGANLGDGGRSIVSLDPPALLAAASAVTGLDDFGDDWFRAPLARLCESLEREAHLTLVGRLLARAELQRLLQNRLQIEAWWAAHPELADERIVAPIVVTGLGRSGTTLLHELLAQDPENRVPMQWEVMYSVPPPERASYATDDRIVRVRNEIGVMDAADPAFSAMHELAADLPTECIYLFAHDFASDMFVGEFDVPTYALWAATADLSHAYGTHRRYLALLQSRHRGTRWVLKAPSHLARLETLFATHPDARVVITHRDPLRVVGSLASLMATLRRMRSDRVDRLGLAAGIAVGFAHLLDGVMAARAAGRVPGERITDVRYTDLVADPIDTVRRLYAGWGLVLDATVERRMRAHLDAARHDARPTHAYRFEDTGLDVAEQRARFEVYLERHGVTREV